MLLSHGAVFTHISSRPLVNTFIPTKLTNVKTWFMDYDSQCRKAFGAEDLHPVEALASRIASFGKPIC